jgi:tight adherence protein C
MTMIVSEWFLILLFVMGLALLFLALSYLYSESKAAKSEQTANIEGRGERLRALPLFSSLFAGPLAWISVRIRNQVGAASIQRISARLVAAGLDGTLEPVTFVAMKGLAASLVLAMTSAYLAIRVDPISAQVLCMVFIASVGGALLPESWLSDTIKLRQLNTLKSLPFYIELLKIAIEAGSNVQGALQYAVAYGPPGPLRNEFSKVLGDIKAGRTRAESLQQLAKRINLVAVSHLCTAIISSEKQGASLTGLLQAQAEQRRNERFTLAETAAMKAPVKMLGPLVMFIFPGTFIILFFPVVVRLFQEGLIG